MKSVAVIEPGRIELVDIPNPDPGPYEAVIKTEVSFLCNATDRKIIDGHFPGIEQYPVLLGHESVGIVESIGSKVTSFEKGDRVVGGLVLNPTDKRYHPAWGGFSEYILAVDHEAMVKDGVAGPEHGWNEVYRIQKKVPETIPVEAAALLCTWREVYAGFSDFHLTPKKDILVFGAGPVGLSFVKFGKLMGFSYIASVDPLKTKRDKALSMGADQVFSPDDPKLQLLTESRGKALDAVIDAVGSENIINSAVSLITMAGSICVYGVIDKPEITLKKSKGPYNFNLLIHQWPTRDAEAAAQEPLCRWIDEGKLDYRDFISREYPINEIQAAFDFSKSEHAIKTLLRWL